MNFWDEEENQKHLQGLAGGLKKWMEEFPPGVLSLSAMKPLNAPLEIQVLIPSGDMCSIHFPPQEELLLSEHTALKESERDLGTLQG